MMDDLHVQEKLSDLLYRDLFGELDEEEKILLNSLIQKHGVKRVEREKIIARLQEKDVFDGRKACRQFEFEKKRSRDVNKCLVWCVSVAVSIVVVYVMGLWLNTGISTPDKLLTASQIEPGYSRAVITLDDGKEIEIGGDLKELEERDGTIILSRSGKLMYTPKMASAITIFNTVRTPRGGEYSLILADGTQVWLNAETKLRFPVSFLGDTREVFLEGEAYFQVTKNEKQPFVVRASMGEVKVLGTSFNVRDYRDEQVVITTLVSGKVIYTEGDDTKGMVVLMPNFQVIDRKDQGLEMRKVDPMVYTGWKGGKFLFDGATLEEIMRTLGRWYDIDVVYVDADVKKLHFTGDLERYESISVFLNFIETGGDVKFEIEGKTIMIRKK